MGASLTRTRGREAGRRGFLRGAAIRAYRCERCLLRSGACRAVSCGSSIQRRRDRHARKPAGTQLRDSGATMTLEMNGRTVEAQNGDTLLDGGAPGRRPYSHAVPLRGPAAERRVPDVRGRGGGPARPRAELRVPGGRRPEGPDPLAARRRRAPHAGGTAARQPPGRLPVLRPQQRVPAAGPRGAARRPPPALLRREDAGAHGRGEPVDCPRPGEVHPVRQVRARVRGGAGGRGDRLHRARQQDAHRPGVRRRPQRQQLHQLRAVRGGVPGGRAGRDAGD